MRNLQKILALVLALIMSFSLVATAGAFSDDGDISDAYKDAVTVLNGLEVFKGYDNGATFQPKGNITRAEVAAIIYRIATGDVKDTQASIYSTYGQFTDVLDGSWYAGYVNYCANAGYIKGRGNKIFDPQATVTGYEALAMILRAVGYDKNGEFTGSNWQIRTASIANERGISKNVTSAMLGQAATREVVAELLFRSIIIPKVNFNANTLSYTEKPLNADGKKDTLGYESLKLEEIEGVVTANEYADLEATEPLSANRTRLDVDGVDYTLEYKSDLDYLGESRIAYVQNLTGSKIVNNVLLLGDTGDNVVYDEGKKIDTKDAAAEKGIKLREDTTQYFVNYDPIDEYQADWRIEYVYTWTTNTYAAVERVRNNKGTLRNLDTNTTVNTDVDLNDLINLDRTQAYKFEYRKTIAVGEFLTPTDISLINTIFSTADYEGDYILGEVYVGTTSIKKTDDISDDISYREFVDTYLTLTDNKKVVEKNGRGNRLKLIDNNNDGVVEYVLQTKYTVTTVSKTDSDGKFVLENKNVPLDANDVVNEIDNDTKFVKEDGSADLALNDVVLYAVIDGNARTEKAEMVNAKIDKVNRTNGEVTTTDGTTYEDSSICAHAEHYNDNPKEMAGNTNYNLYLDKYGYLAAFNEAEESFALLVDGWYNRVKGGDEYAVKTWQDGKLQTVDVSANGDLFIGGANSLNNDWDQIRTLDNATGSLNNANRTDVRNDVHTSVAMLSSDGVLTPVDMAYHTLKQSYIIDMKDNRLPDRDGERGQIYTTRANAIDRTAYNVAGVGADADVDVRALSSTVYYFVYNALSGNRTITQVVREYVGYQNLPNSDYANYIEDVYAVGTTQTSSVNNPYYTAEVVVVELNNDYYNTLGGEQVFIPRFPIAGTNVTLEEVKLVRENGAFEEVTIDLSRSDLRYYDIANGTETNANRNALAAGLYRMWRVSDSDTYYVRYMSAAEIDAADRYYVGMVDYNTGTGAHNYTVVDLYGRDVNDAHARATGASASALNLDTTKYYTYKGDELTESDRNTVMIQTPTADIRRTDTCVDWRNETQTNGGYQRNEVLIAYDKADNGEERIAYAISFNEYDSWDSPNSHVHDAAQTVWDSCTPYHNFGGVTPDPTYSITVNYEVDGAAVAAAPVGVTVTGAVADLANGTHVLNLTVDADKFTVNADSELQVGDNNVVIDGADKTVTVKLTTIDPSVFVAITRPDTIPANWPVYAVNSSYSAEITQAKPGDILFVDPKQAVELQGDVSQNADGSYTVLEGAATITLAVKDGWSFGGGMWMAFEDGKMKFAMNQYTPGSAGARTGARAANDPTDPSNPEWLKNIFLDAMANPDVIYEITVNGSGYVFEGKMNQEDDTFELMLKGGVDVTEEAAKAFIAAVSSGNPDAITVKKVENETPTPETGTVHVSADTNAVQIKAADGEWRMESNLTIVDGMVTLQVRSSDNPYIIGTATGKFERDLVNGNTWTAKIPASDGDEIVVSSTASAVNTVTMTAGPNVNILGANTNGVLAIPYTTISGKTDKVSFRVAIPAGNVPQPTIKETGATVSVNQVNDTTWDVVVTPTAGANYTGVINCTQNIPTVTIGEKDSRIEITDAPATAPTGTYVLKLTAAKGYEPSITGATVASMDAGDESNGKIAWTVTLTGITGNVTLDIALVEVRSLEIIRAVWSGTAAEANSDAMTVETSYAGMQGRAKLEKEAGAGKQTYKSEFVVCVRGNDRLLSAGQIAQANGGGSLKVSIIPYGYERRQDDASSPTGYWGKWKIEVTGLDQSVITNGFKVVRRGAGYGEIKTISKEDASIILEDIVAFSYAYDDNTGNVVSDKRVTFKVKTDGSAIPDVKVDGTDVKAKKIEKTAVDNEWMITLDIPDKASNAVNAGTAPVPTEDIKVIPLLMPQMRLVDNGNKITIAENQPIYAKVVDDGTNKWFTGTFSYTKPAGTKVSEAATNSLLVAGPDKANGWKDGASMAAGYSKFVLSDGATSGTLTVSVKFTNSTAFSAGGGVNTEFVGFGKNHITRSDGVNVHTVPKNGVNAPIMITAAVDSYTGYDVTLLPAQNGEFTVLGPDGYHDVSDAKGNAYFTIWMDNKNWEIVEDPGNYVVSGRHTDLTATQITVKVENVTGPREVELKFVSVGDPDVSYTATSKNIINANKADDGKYYGLFEEKDTEFPGKTYNQGTPDQYFEFNGTLKNGRGSWRIFTDPTVEPTIKATSNGKDVSNLFDVEFLGINRRTRNSGGTKLVAEWKISVSGVKDQTNIDFRTSNDTILPSGDLITGVRYTLKGLDKNDYLDIEWQSYYNEETLRVGDMLNGAYHIVLGEDAKPHMVHGDTEGTDFQFIVLVKDGYKIKDCHILNNVDLLLGKPYVTYEYNNTEYSFVPTGYHAAVISVKSERPVEELGTDYDMVLTAEIDR